MNKSRIYIYATALICAFFLLFLVGCAIGERTAGSGSEEPGESIVGSLNVGSSETESVDLSDTASATDVEAATETETETESETKDYGMGFVPV